MTLRCLTIPVLCLSLLFGFQNYASAQTKSSYPIFAVGINWGLNSSFFGGVAGMVENVPADLRTVPSHEGDAWIYGKTQVLRTIPFSSIEPNPLTNLSSFFIGPEVTFFRLRIRTGINFSWTGRLEQGRTKSNEGATREVNQHGLPNRGSGTSLVYYNMYVKSTLIPGWFGEAGVSLTRNFSVVGGWGLNNFNLEIESGYDRYGSLETYDTYKAATVRLRRTYGGIEVELPIDNSNAAVAFQILVGRTADPLTAGDMTVSQEHRWSAIIGISLRHRLTR